MPYRETNGATTAQIKDDIDSGRTGDKIDFPDPAAAPLGTDEEAAGTPTPPGILQEERTRQLRHAYKTTGDGRIPTATARGVFAWPLVGLTVLFLAGLALALA